MSIVKSKKTIVSVGALATVIIIGSCVYAYSLYVHKRGAETMQDANTTPPQHDQQPEDLLKPQCRTKETESDETETKKNSTSSTDVPTVEPSSTAIPPVEPSSTAIPPVVPSSTDVPLVVPPAPPRPPVVPSSTIIPPAPSSTAKPPVEPLFTAIPPVASSTTIPPVAPPNINIKDTATSEASTPPNIKSGYLDLFKVLDEKSTCYIKETDPAKRDELFIGVTKARKGLYGILNTGTGSLFKSFLSASLVKMKCLRVFDIPKLTEQKDEVSDIIVSVSRDNCIKWLEKYVACTIKNIEAIGGRIMVNESDDKKQRIETRLKEYESNIDKISSEVNISDTKDTVVCMNIAVAILLSIDEEYIKFFEWLKTLSFTETEGEFQAKTNK